MEKMLSQRRFKSIYKCDRFDTNRESIPVMDDYRVKRRADNTLRISNIEIVRTKVDTFVRNSRNFDVIGRRGGGEPIIVKTLVGVVKPQELDLRCLQNHGRRLGYMFTLYNPRYLIVLEVYTKFIEVTRCVTVIELIKS